MKLKLCLLQMNSGEDVGANAQWILDYADSFKDAHLTMAPENALYCGRGKGMAEAFSQIESQVWASLEAGLPTLSGPLILGGVPFQKGEKFFNEWVQWDGTSWTRPYRKQKLFQCRAPGQRQYDETQQFIAGEGGEVMTLKTTVGEFKLGPSTCFDLRYPDIYTDHRKNGAQVLAVPSAFTQVTGEAHWHTLLRARAIENQCFVIAPGQVGQAPGERESFGHSLVIDPWGKVLLDAEKKVGAFTCEIDLSQIQKIREQIYMGF